jgi:hypothetical protein
MYVVNILYNVGVLGPLRYLSLLNTNVCHVLGYWRHRSVCYTSLFTTSLVVTTISVYNVLGPSDVVSRSGSRYSLDLVAWIFIHLCLWSLFCFSLLCLFSLCVSSILSVSVRLSAAPQIVFASRKEYTSPPPPWFHFPLLRFPTIWLLRNFQQLKLYCVYQP